MELLMLQARMPHSRMKKSHEEEKNVTDMLPYHTDGATRYPSKLWYASLLFLIAHWRLQNDPLHYCTLNLITIILHLPFSFTLRSFTSITVAVLSRSDTLLFPEGNVTSG
jgi:uncharacterized membrane protein